MKNIKGAVPSCWDLCKDSYKLPEKFNASNLARDYINKKNLEIEQALEQYLLFKYNTTIDTIKMLAERMHNFKVKGMECFVTSITRGTITTYVDNGVVFMRVSESAFGYGVEKLWEEL